MFGKINCGAVRKCGRYGVGEKLYSFSRFRLLSSFFFFIFYVLFSLSSRSFAVDFGGAAYFAPGVIVPTGLSSLNSYISTRGFEEIPSYGFEFGGYGYYFIKNFVVGGGGAGGFTPWVESTANTLSLNYGYGQGLFGYVVIDREKFFLFPLLGIGGGGVGLSVTSKETKDFANLLANPSPADKISLSRGMLVGTLSLDFIYFIGKLREPKREGVEIKKAGRGFILGIKGGYFLDIPIGSWRIRGTRAEVRGVPDFNISHIFVILSIGGGGLAYR